MAATVAQDRDRIDRAIHHAIALAAGLSPVLAWLWPLGFETFLAVAAVAVLAEQRSRPHKTPWYPWVLTALAAGSSIALNFGHTPTSPWTHRRGCWWPASTASPRSPPHSRGTCSCCAWPTAARATARTRTPAASTPRTRTRSPASRPTARTSRPRSPSPGSRPDRQWAGRRAVPGPGAGPARLRDPGPAGVLAGRRRPHRTVPLPGVCAAAGGTRPPGRRQRPPAQPRPHRHHAMTRPSGRSTTDAGSPARA
jgi:hypothetical protein